MAKALANTSSRKDQALHRSEPHFTDFDIHLWNQSKHYRAYEKLGAHLCVLDDTPGVHFSVWAPNAASVSVIGSFNTWDRSAHPMQLDENSGIWRTFVAGVQEDAHYKYFIRSGWDDYETERADPYAFCSQRRPETASRVWDINRYEWQDQEWMERRREVSLYKMPLNIYELHLGSWMRHEDGEWLNYRDLGPRLAQYAKEMSYTHIELLPVTEHPYDGSWGYQATGYFAPTSRFGTPDDFMFFVDSLHQEGIGVILDWVPAHFPMDGHALGFFDGTHLYEHEDPRQGVHPEWGTFIFNYGLAGVKNFLISSALFWLERYHIDGIRVDAVASMLYLDYGREAGEYIPNEHGGRENLDAVRFLREFNTTVKKYHPDVFTCAEESTSWPKVTRGAEEGGLGFTFKWNMGWMNDTLQVFEMEPIHRKHHHNKLTFGMMYQYSENFLLPLSHDEVVHLKKAMLTKMPGDDWQRFANLRLLFGYQIAYPGKKLNFMGGEFGQWGEWNFEQSLDWHLLEMDAHQGLQNWVKEINNLYLHEPALYELDSWPEGFEWISCDDYEQSVLTFLRFPEERTHAILLGVNFTPVAREAYPVGLPWGGEWECILNSDHERFGGSGQARPEGYRLEAQEQRANGREHSIQIDLPPLGVIVLRGIRPPRPVGSAKKMSMVSQDQVEISEENAPESEAS